MHLNLPPLIPYVVGALLVVFGLVRAKVLGAPRSPRPTDQDDDQAVQSPRATDATEPADVRGPEQKRHIRWGILWVLMGLFLLISTFIQTHRR